MSVVVATRDKEGYVHLASDSMASTVMTDTQLDVCKVNITADMDVIIGNVGNMSLTSLKYYSILPPHKYRPVELDEEFFLTQVRYELIKIIHNVDIMASEKGFSGELLIAYGKQLYVFDGQYAMYPVYQKSYAIGSGEYHASSAIKVLDTIDGLTIREKLMSAVNVTQQYVSSVGNNTYYVNTKDLQLMKLPKDYNNTLIIEPDEYDDDVDGSSIDNPIEGGYTEDTPTVYPQDFDNFNENFDSDMDINDIADLFDEEYIEYDEYDKNTDITESLTIEELEKEIQNIQKLINYKKTKIKSEMGDNQ